jgi:hypothetical protein
VSIAAISTECYTTFLKLSERVQESQQHKSDSRLQSVLLECRGRFNVWVGNCGAHQRGKGSLDYRLRDSSTMKAAVIRFLYDLRNLLLEGKRPFFYRCALETVASNQRLSSKVDIGVTMK